MFVNRTNPHLRFIEGEDNDGGAPEKDAADKGAETRDEDLGEKGETALRRERELRRKADAEVRRLRAAEKELAALREEGASAQDRAIAEARREAAEEATRAANARILSAEARALAGTMEFHNPSTAVRLLDLDHVRVEDDGSFDEDAVRDLLKELAKDHPYLVKGTEEERTPGHRRVGLGGRSNDGEPTDADGRIAAGLRASMK